MWLQRGTSRGCLTDRIMANILWSYCKISTQIQASLNNSLLKYIHIIKKDSQKLLGRKNNLPIVRFQDINCGNTLIEAESFSVFK